MTDPASTPDHQPPDVRASDPELDSRAPGRREDAADIAARIEDFYAADTTSPLPPPTTTSFVDTLRRDLAGGSAGAAKSPFFFELRSVAPSDPVLEVPGVDEIELTADNRGDVIAFLTAGDHDAWVAEPDDDGGVVVLFRDQQVVVAVGEIVERTPNGMFTVYPAHDPQGRPVNRFGERDGRPAARSPFGPDIEHRGYTLRGAGAGVARVDVVPRPVHRVLRRVGLEACMTVWPKDAVTGGVPGELDNLVDLAYWHTVRCLTVVSYLVRNEVPDADTLFQLGGIPQAYTDADEMYTTVPLHAAETLRPHVLLPLPVRHLLVGRLEHALIDRPRNVSKVVRQLVARGGPVTVPHESRQNRAYGAEVAASLYATWASNRAARWPLAAAWAAMNLTAEWIEYATIVRSTPQHTGLAPYGGDPHYRAGFDLPPWSDLVLGNATALKRTRS